MTQFTSGVSAYQDCPEEEAMPEAPCVWRQGNTRLLDYGSLPECQPDAPPVLVVPSLVNRSYILDLNKKTSLLRDMLQRGLRPFLVDWDTPGEEEKDYGTSDYIMSPLQNALNWVSEAQGRAVGVVGYCMGGTLCVPLAQYNPDRITGVAFLATPWDFHADNQNTVPVLKAMAPSIEVYLKTLGHLPVDVLQAMFAGLDPYQTTNKFRKFSKLAASDEKLGEKRKLFVAMEDWLNDGVPLTENVARECLLGWYLENTPAAGKWVVGPGPADPSEIIPAQLVIIPELDYIVPPRSSEALFNSLDNATCMHLSSGHIGMVIGSRAKSLLFKPLSEWLLSVSQ